MKARRILIAEDDPSIRCALADTLQAKGYETCLAKDGKQALCILLSQEIDLALIDVEMPEINGFTLLKIMDKECPGTPKIMLTAHGEEKERIKGLELGADDYVLKPFSLAELLARIAAVLRRYPQRAALAPQDLHFPYGKINNETRQIIFNKNGETIELREKEFELFRYFLSYPDRIITQEELLQRVWKITLRANETRTVAVTIARLREKIGEQAASHIENVRARGYRWNSESPNKH